ncbi:MAG TPA: ABC transporter permease [Jiangellaceae bacterium]|nr:ABC transporter permease [Jiangellaceae bacterium]
MEILAKSTWVELKLLLREPLTLVFTLALPIVLLIVLGGVFGNLPDPDVYRGVGPMDFYVPAYIALVTASLGLVGLPVHLAGYRERGVLRRFRASAVPVAALIGAHVLVTLALATVSAVLVIAAAALIYDIHAPAQVGGVIVAFVLAALTFAAIGILLGLSMPTARSAQGAGVMAWFVMLILTGAGPPREVMTTAMQWIGDLLPLRYVTLLVQDPWLGFGWNWAAMLAVFGFLVGAALLAAIVVQRVI